MKIEYIEKSFINNRIQPYMQPSEDALKYLESKIKELAILYLGKYYDKEKCYYFSEDNYLFCISSFLAYKKRENIITDEEILIAYTFPEDEFPNLKDASNQEIVMTFRANMNDSKFGRKVVYNSWLWNQYLLSKYIFVPYLDSFQLETITKINSKNKKETYSFSFNGIIIFEK